MKIKKHKVGLNIRKVKKPSGSSGGFVNKITEFLELPSELVGDNVKITLIGNEYLYLEGKHKIADYYDYYIRIITQKIVLNISGKNLEIKEMTSNELVVCGTLSNLEYEIRGLNEN